MTVIERLADLGIVLPTPMAPVATYVPVTIAGQLVIVSGQLPAVEGKVAVTGRLGAGVSIDEEMTNLINYQQSYAASARFITTISSLYNTLLNTAPPQ